MKTRETTEISVEQAIMEERAATLKVLAHHRTLDAIDSFEDSPELVKEYKNEKDLVDSLSMELRGEIPNPTDKPFAERVKEIAEFLEERIESLEDICRRVGFYRGFADGKKLYTEDEI